MKLFLTILAFFLTGSFVTFFTYKEAYFRGYKDGANDCAKKILPVVRELVGRLKDKEKSHD